MRLGDDALAAGAVALPCFGFSPFHAPDKALQGDGSGRCAQLERWVAFPRGAGRGGSEVAGGRPLVVRWPSAGRPARGSLVEARAREEARTESAMARGPKLSCGRVNVVNLVLHRPIEKLLILA